MKSTFLLIFALSLCPPALASDDLRFKCLALHSYLKKMIPDIEGVSEDQHKAAIKELNVAFASEDILVDLGSTFNERDFDSELVSAKNELDNEVSLDFLERRIAECLLLTVARNNKATQP